jgi:hypothetical protein
VTKEQAAKQHTDIIGEDFMTFLGENATILMTFTLKLTM